jgi:hypothetical protein
MYDRHAIPAPIRLRRNVKQTVLSDLAGKVQKKSDQENAYADKANAIVCIQCIKKNP